MEYIEQIKDSIEVAAKKKDSGLGPKERARQILLKKLENFGIQVVNYESPPSVDFIMTISTQEAIYYVEKLVRRRAIFFWGLQNENISILDPIAKVLVFVE